MSAEIIQFPTSAVVVQWAASCWLVKTPNDNGWIYGCRSDAVAEAQTIAAGHGVDVRVIR